MKKIIMIFMVILMSLSLASCGNDSSTETESDTLVVGMELAYPPFETKDSAGEPYGISVDFVNAFSEYIGKEVKIENTSWDGLIPSLQTGKVDMVMSSMTITDDRKNAVDFTVPYADSSLAVLANKNSNISTIDDLNVKGKKIAVKTGSTGYFYALENLKNAEVVALSDESACVTEVVLGKVDGFIYDQLTIYRNQKANKDTTTASYIATTESQWGIAVKKGNEELLAKLNEFIPKYKSEGGFVKSTDKHLAEEKKAFDELGFKWFFN